MISQDEFEEATLNAFASLMQRYGLVHEYTRMLLPDYYVSLLGRHLRVIACYEVGSRPWVVLEALGRPAGEAPTKVSLEVLFEQRAKQEAGAHEETAPRNSLELQSMLEKKARELEEHGADLLRGDFSMLPRLDARAEQLRHIREKDLF